MRHASAREVPPGALDDAQAFLAQEFPLLQLVLVRRRVVEVAAHSLVDELAAPCLGIPRTDLAVGVPGVLGLLRIPDRSRVAPVLVGVDTNRPQLRPTRAVILFVLLFFLLIILAVFTSLFPSPFSLVRLLGFPILSSSPLLYSSCLGGYVVRD